jgi:hypothetical protein
MTLNNDPNILFNSQSQGGAPDVPVSIYWGEINISDITGPTPFVDISKEINRQENGVALSIRNSITLTGKIVRFPDPPPSDEDDCRDRVLNPDVKGITGLLTAIDNLETIFKRCSTSKFEIKCKSQGADTSLYTAKNVNFLSLNIEKSDDNWTQTANFTINLEFEEAICEDKDDDRVKETSDTWTIEPLDDSVYTRFVQTVQTRPEWSNPKLHPSAPRPSSPNPQGPPPFRVGRPINDFQVINVPQFRVTRRLSAKGIPTADPEKADKPCETGNCKDEEQKVYPSYIFAKAWVEKQTKLAFNGQNASGGQPYFTKTPNMRDFQNTWVYNYNRSVNIDITNGTYEATDTWIAMPTGMPYIESYTVESSTSQEMIKTVRVAGNVQGLSLTPFDVMQGNTGLFPTGTGSIAAKENINKIDLGFSLSLPSGGNFPQPYDLPDVSGAKSKITKLENNKYTNALSGWLSEVKPYLYRRAHLAVNGADREYDYISSFRKIPQEPPENPIYSKETLLGVFPVSTSEGHDPAKGTISYSYEYNNRFTIISGVLSENISITNEGPADSVSETQVPGRLLGPILNKTGSTALRKTLSIEITVMPPTGVDGFFVQNPVCPVYTGGYIIGVINKLVEGVRPFGSMGLPPDRFFFGEYASKKNRQGQVFVNSDQDTWSPTEGRYSRTVSWTYQQCTNARFYLDH